MTTAATVIIMTVNVSLVFDYQSVQNQENKTVLIISNRKLMELVTWVIKELKSKQETARNSKISKSRKQTTIPRLKGPREETVKAGPCSQDHPEEPQLGGPQRREVHWLPFPPAFGAS